MAKFTKSMRIARFFESMERYGISYQDADNLRRIEMTLQRWSEQECGDGNEYGSWAIERDETTEKPFMIHHHYRHGKGQDTVTRSPIADREKGALKRLAAIMANYPELIAYHQTDPRGCALYILRKSDVNGDDINSVYTRGLAVGY
jgi:hypothetical protein